MDSERPAEPGNHAPHCVVWHLPGERPPADLLAALGKRHVGIEFRTDPFAALAEVCALDRAHHAPESAAHAGAGHGVILVLVRARELGDASDVVRAVEFYAPRARCWRFEPGSSVQLRAVTSAELEAAPGPVADIPPQVVVTPPFRRAATPPPAPGAVRHPAQGRPSLRLAGDGILPARADDDAPPDPLKVREERSEAATPDPARAPAAQVLSPEELAMLLGEDTVEGRNKAGSSRRRTGDLK